MVTRLRLRVKKRMDDVHIMKQAWSHTAVGMRDGGRPMKRQGGGGSQNRIGMIMNIKIYVENEAAFHFFITCIKIMKY